MADKLYDTITGSHKGHSYRLELEYAQLFDRGQLLQKTLTRVHTTVDGKPIYLSTPGFQDLGDPVISVERYIDHITP